MTAQSAVRPDNAGVSEEADSLSEWFPFFVEGEDMQPPLVGTRESPTHADLTYRRRRS